MRKKIAFAGPSITEKEVQYVEDAIRNGWYETFDKDIVALERELCEVTGAQYAITTPSCTMAMHMAAMALGLGAGDEVIVTDFSWVATGASVAYTGATCVFVDIDPDTWCIDPKAIEAAITPKTKAIMMVHIFGQPARMDEIMAIADRHGLAVIEDAAPALGSSFQGRQCGTIGAAGCFSFQGAKLVVAGEGGAFLTNDKDLHDKARVIRRMGRTDSHGAFWCDILGYKYIMSNMQAAMIRAQLSRLDELVAIKRQITAWYEERLAGRPELKMIKPSKGGESNCCYPNIILDEKVKIGRDVLLKVLEEQNIHGRAAFPRMSLMPMFEARFPNPAAAAAASRGMSLPSASNLTEEDIDFVCETLINAVKF